jgi:lipopolysaccharide/colanic/teichoic acid biosynthesis glycosyltransferase
MSADRADIRSGLPRPIEALKAAFFLVLTMPVLVVIGLFVLITSGPPVLFRQRRVGRGGREFTMLKFRTMKMNDQKVQFTSADDDRVTPVGRLLRRLKLDELPELWNVVVGDLSLVGHRPEVPQYVDLENPLWQQVLRERPGITHPVTLRLADEASLIAEAGDGADVFYKNELVPFKLRGYIDYQQQRSFWNDVKVLVATAAAMVGWRWYAEVGLDEVRAAAAADEGRHG